MKTELLELLIRSCVNEALDQMEEEEKLKVKPFVKGKGFKPQVKQGQLSKGVGKEPEGFPVIKPGTGGGLYKRGSVYEADEDPNQPSETPPTEPTQEPQTQQPAEKPKMPEKPEKPEAPTAPSPTSAKGSVFVNPRDKSKLQPLKLQARDDASLERVLHQTAARVAGSGAKVALSAMRMAKEAVKNPNVPVYFYLGKYDPESDEIFLMADKSLQVAKDASVQPAELTGTPVHTLPPQDYNPMTASPTDIVTRMDQKGHTPLRGSGIDENTRSIIKKMVNEILDRR